VEFAVLILRICTYALQFLPSQTPNHAGDTIHGLSRGDILRVCTDVADSLARACVLLDAKGSLVRVQHLLYAALRASCEGRTDQFWDGVVSACRAALRAGIHMDGGASATACYGGGEMERELNRRTFCGLYVLDR
jgi:hypothetical protein